MLYTVTRDMIDSLLTQCAMLLQNDDLTIACDHRAITGSGIVLTCFCGPGLVAGQTVLDSIAFLGKDPRLDYDCPEHGLRFNPGTRLLIADRVYLILFGPDAYLIEIILLHR